ncbi:hypothetical protein CPC08DRAFT_707113 [Agrocybe pediades]|nr:hypothetical protein CPC08DRAFT_707113 [Agrocybe pediades]
MLPNEPEDEFQSNRPVDSAIKRGPEHVRERDSASARKRLKTEDMWQYYQKKIVGWGQFYLDIVGSPLVF